MGNIKLKFYSFSVIFQKAFTTQCAVLQEFLFVWSEFFVVIEK